MRYSDPKVWWGSLVPNLAVDTSKMAAGNAKHQYCIQVFPGQPLSPKFFPFVRFPPKEELEHQVTSLMSELHDAKST